LLQQGGVTYSYDANGNTLEEDDQGVITSYAYNSLNQMVEHGSGGIATGYQYNPDGVRHRQSDLLSATGYLVDGNRAYAQVLAESVDGVTDVVYHFGNDLIAQSRDGQAHYFHVDGLGSTRVLSDTAGSQSARYSYAAFGELLSHSGEAGISYLYSGEQFDSQLDRYYLRARYYNQSVGRFARMDSWMGIQDEPITLNKYLYGDVDPVMNVDPTGHFSLGSFSVANSIQGILAAQTAHSIGVSLFDFSTGERELTALEAGLAALDVLSRGSGSKIFRLFGGGCGRKNSFSGETLVRTELGVVPIRKIQIGDFVLAYDEKTDAVVYRQVIHLISSEGVKELYTLAFDNGEEIVTTAEHPYYMDGVWVEAKELNEGDVLQTKSGKLTLTSVSITESFAKLYNLTVDESSTFYVSASEILTHNADKKKKCKGVAIRGGSYNRVRFTNIGGHVHHMPAKAALPYGKPLLSAGKGPAIWMRAADHRKTRSYGGRGGDYRAQQVELLKKNRWCAAINMDVRDVRRIHKSRYNSSINFYLLYVTESTGKVCSGF
jgi:RHS repeat-associated protein